jgi:hypothetical protein
MEKGEPEQTNVSYWAETEGAIIKVTVSFGNPPTIFPHASVITGGGTIKELVGSQ